MGEEMKERTRDEVRAQFIEWKKWHDETYEPCLRKHLERGAVKCPLKSEPVEQGTCSMENCPRAKRG